jgi:hypothetical protein
MEHGVEEQHRDAGRNRAEHVDDDDVCRLVKNRPLRRLIAERLRETAATIAGTAVIGFHR